MWVGGGGVERLTLIGAQKPVLHIFCSQRVGGIPKHQILEANGLIRRVPGWEYKSSQKADSSPWSKSRGEQEGTVWPGGGGGEALNLPLGPRVEFGCIKVRLSLVVY
jgi:hypothetical protein